MFKTLMLLAMLDDVNYTVNQVPYVSDIDNYGVVQYIASPEEFYRNGGDCEDYAIAKQALLKEKGIDSDVILLIDSEKQDHAVLRVGDYILDNNYSNVQGLGVLDEYENSFLFEHGLVK